MSQRGRVAPGLTLVAPVGNPNVFLLDEEGRPRHRWRTSSGPALATHLTPDGRLLRTGYPDGNQPLQQFGAGGLVQAFDWNSNLVWEFRYLDAKRRLHHDVCPMPNGHILMIAWEVKTREEAMAAGRRPELLEGEQLWPDHVIEVAPEQNNRIVWEWHAWDHLVQDADPQKPNFGKITDHPERIDINFTGSRADPRRRRIADWLHTNSVYYEPERDQIMLSVPGFGEIWIIDHSTTSEQARGSEGGRWGKGGDLLFRWGNPQAHGAGGDRQRELFWQHDAHWIPQGLPGAGNILVFDNGAGRETGEYSRVLEIRIPAASGSAAIVWSFQHPVLFSPVRSGAHRLANGNTLICDGVGARLLEVTPTLEVVWDLKFTPPEGPPAGGLFRVTRYPPSHGAITAMPPPVE